MLCWLSVVHLLSLTSDRFRALTGAEQTDARVLRALHDECIEWQHPVVLRSGWDVWCEWKGNLLVFSTGCDELDTVLAGGVMTDEVTELIGPSSSGKTQLCLMLATNVCATTAASVLYIDTSQSFSVERCSSIHRSWPADEVSELLPTLDRIRHQPCHSIHQLLAILHSLQHELQQARAAFAQSLRVVIVDSIGALLAPVIGGGQQRGHALLSLAAHMLHSLATQHHLAVLLTNHTVARIDGRDRDDRAATGRRSQPALGESWRYVADTRLVLDVLRGAGLRLEDDDEDEADVLVGDDGGGVGGRRGGSVSIVRKVVRVRLSKSVKLPTGASCVCEITNKGLEAVSSPATMEQC